LIDPDLDIGVATDDVLTDREWHSVSVPLEPARRTCHGSLARPSDGRIAAKRVAKSVRRSNVHRPTRDVAECFPNLGNEVGKIRLGDECRRPEAFLQGALGKDLRTIQHKRGEQVERLGRKVNLATLACQLPCVEIEGERAEADPHNGPLFEEPAKFLGVRWDSRLSAS
jgi:hypothetical protein